MLTNADEISYKFNFQHARPVLINEKLLTRFCAARPKRSVNKPKLQILTPKQMKGGTNFLISSSTAATPSVCGLWNLLVALPKSHST